MRITKINIKKIKNKGTIKATADIVLDEAICVHDIKIVENSKGLFISFPYRRNENGNTLDIVHPIKNETREKIQSAILEEYKEIEEK